MSTQGPEHTSPARDACPVDEKTRLAWMKANPGASRPGAPDAAPAAATSAMSKVNGCDSEEIDQSPPSAPPGLFSRWFSSAPPASEAASPTSAQQHALGTQRVVSTIPRASPVDDSEGSKPANSEKESGVSKSGNWIYPSEKMFFDAMKRKGYSSDPKEMQTIVPIHNAVNERAWKEIKEWEEPYGSEQQCGGPRLHSFLGLSTSMSPKARFNSMLGYTAPFDRHDWIVDRCGKKIEYIIDFYAGKDEGKNNGKLSFYLDVRPKLNTFEGWKMRAAKTIGFA